VSELEFNVPFQHKHGYIRDESCSKLSTSVHSEILHLMLTMTNNDGVGNSDDNWWTDGRLTSCMSTRPRLVTMLYSWWRRTIGGSWLSNFLIGNRSRR